VKDPKRLGRLLRVRAVQRDIAEAAEMQARTHAASAEGLIRRIDQLVADVSPAAGIATGIGLSAQASVRARLGASRNDAATRLSTAEALLARREDATRTARRDHNAMEKLLDRAKLSAAAAEMRRLIDTLPHGKAGTKLAEHEVGRG
jgi:flagellar FliJ protein